MKFAQIVSSYQNTIRNEGRQFHIHQKKNITKEPSWEENVCEVCAKNNKREHVRFFDQNRY